MKRLFRILIFSSTAVYLTSLWNKGFSFKGDLLVLLEFAAVFTIVFFLIRPILKIIVWPFNLLTFGFVGGVVNLLLFFGLFYLFPEFRITSWTFPGGNFLGVNLPKIYINEFWNFFLVIFSISFLISFLDNLL